MFNLECSNLWHIFRKFNTRLIINLNQFENNTQGSLSITCDQVGTNSKGINLMTL